VRTQVVAGIKYYIDFYAANAAGKVSLNILLMYVVGFVVSLYVISVVIPLYTL